MKAQSINSNSVDVESNELDTRERLVRAAVDVFLEKGYGGTRVQDIAKRAGYTSGALYVHFPSRTALLGEAIISEGKVIMDDLVRSFEVLPQGPEATAEFLSSLSTGESTNLDLLLIEALALAARSDEAKAVLQSTLSQFVDVTMARVELGQRRGAIDTSLDGDAIRELVISWVFGGILVKSLGLGSLDGRALTGLTTRIFKSLAPTS